MLVSDGPAEAQLQHQQDQVRNISRATCFVRHQACWQVALVPLPSSSPGVPASEALPMQGMRQWRTPAKRPHILDVASLGGPLVDIANRLVADGRQVRLACRRGRCSSAAHNDGLHGFAAACACAAAPGCTSLAGAAQRHPSAALLPSHRLCVRSVPPSYRLPAPPLLAALLAVAWMLAAIGAAWMATAAAGAAWLTMAKAPHSACRWTCSAGGDWCGRLQPSLKPMAQLFFVPASPTCPCSPPPAPAMAVAAATSVAARRLIRHHMWVWLLRMQLLLLPSRSCCRAGRRGRWVHGYSRSVGPRGTAAVAFPRHGPRWQQRPVQLGGGACCCLASGPAPRLVCARWVLAPALGGQSAAPSARCACYPSIPRVPVCLPFCRPMAAWAAAVTGTAWTAAQAPRFARWALAPCVVAVGLSAACTLWCY